MLADGERDFLIGKKLLESKFFDKSVYHFQQSVEKCVKAALIAFGVFQKTHFIGKILAETLKEKELPESWREKLFLVAAISEGMEPDISLSRYPGIIGDKLWLPFEEYEQSDAEKAMKKAEAVYADTRKFLEFWFRD